MSSNHGVFESPGEKRKGGDIIWNLAKNLPHEAARRLLLQQETDCQDPVLLGGSENLPGRLSTLPL